MKSLLKRLIRNQRGNTLIITAAAMPLLIGSAGLATDTIQWALWKRQLQKAADSAAIAGVYAKMAGQNVTNAVNYDVGYPNQTNTAGPNNNRTGYTLLSAPVVSTSPSGIPSDATHGVSVTLQIQQTLPFSSMFLSSTPVITASATAAAVAAGNYCVVSLENTNYQGAISAGGNTSVDFGCGMITDSTSLDAAIAFGSSSVRASPVAAVGGLDTTDNWASGTTLQPFSPALPDPYGSVPTASIPSSCPTFSDNPQSVQTIPSSTPTATPVTQCYNNFTAKGNVTLQPGTYVITGNIDINSSATVTCNGCTFVMTNSTPANTGTLTINGGATMNLTAPDSGTYKGILFYQDRAASLNNSKIDGNSSSFYKGAFYFPNGNVTYNGTAGLAFDCVKLVTRRVTFTGNSKLNNNCPAGWYGPEFDGYHVRLVG